MAHQRAFFFEFNPATERPETWCLDRDFDDDNDRAVTFIREQIRKAGAIAPLPEASTHNCEVAPLLGSSRDEGESKIKRRDDGGLAQFYDKWLRAMEKTPAPNAPDLQAAIFARRERERQRQKLPWHQPYFMQIEYWANGKRVRPFGVTAEMETWRKLSDTEVEAFMGAEAHAPEA